jgi:hypothetical protein
MTPNPLCDIYDYGLLSPDHCDTTDPLSITNPSASSSVSRLSLKATSAQVENLISADSQIVALVQTKTKKSKLEILKLEEDVILGSCMFLGRVGTYALCFHNNLTPDHKQLLLSSWAEETQSLHQRPPNADPPIVVGSSPPNHVLQFLQAAHRLRLLAGSCCCRCPGC